jgi:hypothetical protein
MKALARPECQIVSNAWYFYVTPLWISSAFVIAGVVSFCRLWWPPPEADGRWKHRLSAILGCIFGLAVGGTTGLHFLLTSPLPAERQRILDRTLRTPPERIERLVIKGGDDVNQYRPLTRTDVAIDDPALLRRIAEILAVAPEVSPNHPQTRWSADVELITRDGAWHFWVTATEPGDSNGTLVRPWSERSQWNLGAVRADGLEEVLEEVARKKKGA